jgi:V/A-type H+-transporting ATPase subunit I
VFFDKSGIVAGFLYWVGIAAVTKLFVLKISVPPAYLFAMGAGFILLAAKPFIELVHKKKENKEKKEGFLVSIMENFLDIFEIVIGFTANTVSFIRVGAFALAHAGLFLAIFALSHAMQIMAGNFVSVLTLIVGNIFIIALEGLVVSIQSVRLNYYEFFSKFFITGNRAFKPMKIPNDY